MPVALEQKRVGLVERFVLGLEDPRLRMARGGRIAALAFIVGGLLAIPVNLLIEPANEVVYAMPLFGIVPGFICLVVPWDRVPSWSLHVLAVVSVALISLAMAVASPAYAAYYVFVALAVAIIFERLREVVAHLLLITAGLFVPVVVGSYTGRQTLILALTEAPSLFIVGVLTSILAGHLEASRKSFWELSRQDELTGVGNYRALHERLREEIARHARRDRQFAVIVVDLNDFKQINERFGHLEGDRMLARVGKALREGVRIEDVVFRQGGDEFAVIAPETNSREAEELCARMRVRLRECGSDDRPISAGTGFAIFPGDGHSVDELLGFADVHLLAAKRDERSASEAKRENER